MITIRTMRLIDYWGGIPLCFILTLMRYIIRIFSTRSASKAPQKILFMKPAELGGIILTYPLIKKVKDRYPQAQIFFLTFQSNKSLFEVLGTWPIHKVLTIRDDSGWMFIFDVFRVIFQLRKEKIDVVFDLEFFARFTAILSYLTGAPKRIGFYGYAMEGLYRGELLTHKVPYNPHLHASLMFLSMAQTISCAQKNSPEFRENDSAYSMALPKFEPTQEQKRRLISKLKNFGVPETARIFLVNPGEGRLALREWPLEHLKALIQKILQHKTHYVLIVGTLAGTPNAEKLLKEDKPEGRCVNFLGQTTIPELLTLFYLSKALIANDSGIAHLAALTTIPQFVLFGPETPRVFAPLGDHHNIFYNSLPCSPCLSAYNHRQSYCQKNYCLITISPDEVYDKLLEKGHLDL